MLQGMIPLVILLQISITGPKHTKRLIEPLIESLRSSFRMIQETPLNVRDSFLELRIIYPVILLTLGIGLYLVMGPIIAFCVLPLLIHSLSYLVLARRWMGAWRGSLHQLLGLWTLSCSVILLFTVLVFAFGAIQHAHAYRLDTASKYPSQNDVDLPSKSVDVSTVFHRADR